MNTVNLVSVFSIYVYQWALFAAVLRDSLGRFFRRGVFRMRTRKCFTLIEVLIVILIVAILASAAVPIVRGRINEAKWSEAKSAAGTIRTAVSTYVIGKGVAAADELIGSLGDVSRRELLGFRDGDLTGSYFVPGDYNIEAVNEDGDAVITVTASTANGPPASESITLTFDGLWLE